MTKFICNFTWKTVFVIMVSFLMVSNIAWADSSSKNKQFTEDFNLSDCTFSNTGSNAYYSLDPGTSNIIGGRGRWRTSPG